MKTKLLLLFLFLTITLQAQTNLVPNGDFENWTSSSQPDKWFRSFNGLVFQSTSAQNGSSSTKMQITSGTFNFINSEFFPVVAGKTYRITMYHKLVTGTFSAIDLSLYHKPGTFKEEIAKKTTAVTSSTEWRKLEFDYTPTVSESIEVDIWTTGTLNSEILVDNVSVVDAATIGAAYTLIPDVNFEKKLIALGYDSGTPDGKVLTSNIKAVTSLTLDAKIIADITGIEDFVALKTLNCTSNSWSSSGGDGLLTKLDVSNNRALTSLNVSANKLKTIDISKNVLLTSLNISTNGVTALDVSNNVALNTLSCSNNQLTTLDLSKNVALSYLACTNNKLNTLDLSKNVALKELYCSGNQLTTLDLSKNVALNTLSCYNNQLTTIDLSKNVALSYLACTTNKLNTLDLSTNVALKELYCPINQLTTLDLSKNVALKYLYCSNNALTTLDLSKNIALTTLNCSENKLSSLNLKNGNNTLLTNSNIFLSSNPNLSCILVDDATYTNTNWANKKDSFAFFSPYDCSLTTQIADAKFEDKLIALGIDTDGKNGVVLSSSIATITTLDVANSGILDLKGIEGFKALTTLNCSGNQLKKLDLSKNTTIAILNCANNSSLTCIQVADIAAAEKWNTTKDATASFSLDCTIYTLIPDGKFEDKLIALGIDKDGKNGKVATQSIAGITVLDVNNSGITNLTGIQNFVALKTLSCGSNGLTSLDITKNVALQDLSCNSNKLTTLDLSRNVDLTYLSCYNNQLTTLDVSKNVALTRLVIYYNKLTTLDLSKNVPLIELYCNNNQLTTLDLSKNAALKSLDCETNQLTTLDLSNNVALERLDCETNQLTTLNLSNNVALERLECQNNKLTSLDVSKNVALTTLNCGPNQISSLDVSKNVALNTLYCTLNQITTLDLSKNVALTTLYCSENKLSSLNLKNGNNTLIKSDKINLSKNPNLNCIVVDDVAYANTNWAGRKDTLAFFSPYECSLTTQIADTKFEDKLIALGIDTDGKNGVILNSSIATLTTLDVSNSGIIDLKGIEGFKALTTLNCSGNQLKKVDLSKNTTIATLNCSNNSSLTCIQVADIAAAEKWNTTKDATASFSLDCTIFTLIPDAKFEDKLIALGIDKDGKNGKVKTESIAGITALDVNNSGITNLTGIQDFVALKTLYCYSNGLTSLDITKNVALQKLYCNSNQLTTLDVSKNVALTTLSCHTNKLTTLEIFKNVSLNLLYCSDNQLTSLDLSKNVALENLYCSSNQISSLDISINEALKILYCDRNKLTTLDLSKNVALEDLKCYSNQLTTLDLSKNLSLITLTCYTNQLTTLDLSKNVALTSLDCETNQLTTLDLSKNVALTSLDVRNNKFLTINLKNGKNTLITTNSIDLRSNPNLKCILVDDVTYATANWATKKDASASFNATDCTLYTLIPDTNFEQKLIDLGIDTDGKNGKVITSNIVSLTKLNVSNSSITNLTGIEDFNSLTELVCDTNGLTTINLAKNEVLLSLDCSNNKLTSLDVTKNINLKTLYCSNNELSTLNVSLNKNLTELSCNSNKLSALDVTKNTTLTSLSCSTNQLKTLDVSKNTQLQSLSTSQNLLEQLNVTNNTKLESIVCNNNLLSTLDLSKNVKITTIDCSYNKLKSLNLRNGNNAFGAGMMFVKNFTNNPVLTCIEVDDVNYSNTKWATYKDATASYSTDCKFSLPSNNFAIESKGETCLNTNNGEINITATAAYGYKATINTTAYTFTNNSLKVTNLAPGTYKVTITIPGETFEQIFTIVIPKGATITGKSSVAAEKVAVEIATGTAPYTVFLNGVEQFETNATSFTVDAKTGGLLEVKTAKACEGIYAKDIATLTGTISAFPNPTSGAFEIEIPATNKEVSISIYALDGQLISNKIYTVENGKVQLSLENQPAGIYMTKVEFDQPIYVKIIKK
ncbi:T9SS type A sorting domain-containing protein [Flavobacterium succinicans]|uniref:Internalin-J n=1 Tax=Flavobacterium succinicans TaxID=29536 RepID=A0A199XP47_9FLAO|nr:T9SS type A sorting domain-containing protein [Flavobacterium succinicans]OAZ03420.1 internalin-J precursor [Flavobacterium succinicans]